MAVTPATLKAFFPEFAITGDAGKVAARDAMLQAFIDDAAGEVGDAWADVGGRDWTDKGVRYLAAHKLATSPFGMNAKLSEGDGKSVYGVEYERMVLLVASARGRVTGYKDSDLGLLGSNVRLP